MPVFNMAYFLRLAPALLLAAILETIATLVIITATSEPVKAQDSSVVNPVCQYTITDVLPTVSDFSPVVLDKPEDVKAFITELAARGVAVNAPVTRVLLLKGPTGKVFYGLEVDGCLTPAQPMPLPAPQQSL